MLRRLLHCRKASQLRRRLSSDSKEIFDRALKERQRAFTLQGSSFEQYDYLRVECAERLVDRLDDISRTFPSVLELGAHRGHIAQIMRSRNGPDADTLVGGVERLVQCDMAGCFTHSSTPLRANGIETSFLRADEENLKFEDNSFDLVLSSLALHWVNDLPSSLKRIREILRPDGAFIGCMLGGSTLQELRHCFFLAEQERKGGVSPHCSPLVRPSDVASLLQGAGFSLPTVDVDTLTVSYPDAFALMEHLQGMGEQMASHSRRYAVGRDTLVAMASIYQELFGDGDEGIKATFQVIYMIGWSPHSSQPRSLKRGSAEVSLKDVL